MRKILKIIEKKGHDFKGNVMANKELLQVLSAILPLFLFKTYHDRHGGYLSKLTSDMGITPP